MPGKQVEDFLNSHHMKYITIRHSPAYTAQEIAASAHIPGKELAKTVIVKLDGKPAMAVLPASSLIDFELLMQVTGASSAALASEQEFQEKFPDCEVGAMPPFGPLYGMDVYVEEVLTTRDEIAFNAGSHSVLIRMAYKDVKRLVRPKVVHFA